MDFIYFIYFHLPPFSLSLSLSFLFPHLKFSSCSWCSFAAFFLLLLLLLSVANLNDFSFLMRFDWGFD